MLLVPNKSIVQRIVWTFKFNKSIGIPAVRGVCDTTLSLISPFRFESGHIERKKPTSLEVGRFWRDLTREFRWRTNETFFLRRLPSKIPQSALSSWTAHAGTTKLSVSGSSDCWNWIPIAAISWMRQTARRSLQADPGHETGSLQSRMN